MFSAQLSSCSSLFAELLKAFMRGGKKQADCSLSGHFSFLWVDACFPTISLWPLGNSHTGPWHSVKQSMLLFLCMLHHNAGTQGKRLGLADWGDGAVWQCFLYTHEDLSECNPQNPYEKLDVVLEQLVIPVPGRQRQADRSLQLTGWSAEPS